jgi:CRP-like cAMP-binding protein
VYYTNSDIRLHDADHSAEFGQNVSRTSLDRQTPLFFNNDVLRAFRPEIIGEIAPYVRRVKVAKDDFIFQQDDSVNTIYFPESAILSEFHLLEDGRMVEVAMTGRDGVIGLSSVFGPVSITNCVQVIQAGNILVIESSDLKHIVSKHPELVGMLLGTVESHIRQLSQKVVCNMYHSLESRLCTWLLRFTDRSENDVLKLTHEQLARVMGVYRPSVTCIAIGMKERAVIDYSRGGVTIKNRRELERAACGCYVESQAQVLYHGANLRIAAAA